MKNLLNYIGIFMLLVIFFPSCSSIFLANPGIDPIVFTKPVYRDSASIGTFVGGKLNRSEYLNRYETLDDNYFGQIYAFQTITNKYYNTSYGFFGYLGKMGIGESANPFLTNYSTYFGGGVSSDIQLTIPFGSVVFKPLGLKGSFIYEDGPYFQQRLSDWSMIGFAPDKFMGNLSQTAGIDFTFKKSSLGLDISSGYSLTMPHFMIDMTFSAILKYTTPKWMIYLQKSASVISANDDLVIGFNYRLK